MYFVLAIYYLFSAIGLASIIVFIGLLLCLTDSEMIEKDIGYTNYFIVLGAYALTALPLAATLAGGLEAQFLFYLGCTCPGLLAMGDGLAKNHVARRALLLASSAPSPDAVRQAGQHPPASDADTACPAYVPAPSSLATDFDVPPQR